MQYINNIDCLKAMKKMKTNPNDRIEALALKKELLAILEDEFKKYI